MQSFEVHNRDCQACLSAKYIKATAGAVKISFKPALKQLAIVILIDHLETQSLIKFSLPT